MKICCFAGHKDCYDESIRKLIESAVEKLIEQENVKEFWAGNYGGFDRISASAVCQVKKRHPDIKLNLVIPYLTQNIREVKKDFDDIIVADIPESTPMKYRIIKTNEYMINNSSFLICYIKFLWGGAARTLEFAQKKKNIRILNLYN